jgi:flagellar basal body rod protein FlgG
MDVTSIQQDVVARNLAHANQPGYRRQVLSFETFLARNALVGALAELHQDFTPGDPVYTGADLDVALVGDGFFVVEDPSGLLYTRNGTFHRNAQGRLVTFDGRPVLGMPGPRGEDLPITIPRTASMISILDNGTVVADRVPVGRLRLARFSDNQRLTRVGTTLFRPPNDLRPQLGVGEVRQGYRERSNGEMVSELMHMVFGFRHYEASERALRSLSDAVEQNTRPQAR